MREYKVIQTIKYILENWIQGRQCGFDFTEIERGEWGIDKVVEVPNTGWIIITFYRDK